ncbi:hypothetical protein FCOIX_10026 [Fusarium coicis]|nr:hypothetical protein FCOIX_10026 [Fusarium coicis]
MFASGSNAGAGSSLETYDRDSTVAVFDPATEDDNPSARQYSIDSQGRIVNDLGWYLYCLADGFPDVRVVWSLWYRVLGPGDVLCVERIF